MFTPEDEIDELHVELGRWRRRLDDAQRARGKPGTDYVEVDKTVLRCRVVIEGLERDLAGRLAEDAAAAEMLGLEGDAA